MKSKYTKPIALLADYPSLPTPLDYSKIESVDEWKSIVEDATLIIAVDKKSNGFYPVYGAETMRAIQQGIIPNQKWNAVVFAIDYASDELEHILAAVHTAKGYAEYNGEVLQFV